MVCPHCGAKTSVGAGRCASCNGVLEDKKTQAATGVLTPVPPPPEDVTRLSVDTTGLTTPAPVSDRSEGRTSAGQGTGVRMPHGTDAPLVAGQTFGGRYNIIRLLGVGGMGAVYHAWDAELGIPVAIKVIRPEIAADPVAAAELQRRFKRELLLARQVTHRNVVRIHDLGEIDGIKYITMPFIQGQDLATILRSTGKLPVSAAISLAKQIVAGLQAAHEAGVVHRDLKPANIMVEEDRAVIMDFGIARAADGGASTVLGTVVGTLEYMAPEQARGETVDHRADLYAVGLILYDMLVGRRQATRADSIVAELMGRMQHVPPAPRTIDPQIPEAVDRIVMRCLQPDPADRYQSAAELAADLNGLDADGHPLAGRTVGLIPTRGGRAGLRRIPTWAWAVAAAVAIVVVAGMFLSRNRATETAKAPTVHAPPVTVAILPFRNASGDPSLDWLGGSFAEMLRTELGESAYLHTVSSDRVHQILRDLRLSTETSFGPDILRKLADYSNADTLLWGQYVRFGPEIRINATLENVKEQRSIALSASVPNDASLPAAVGNMADSVRGAVASSPDIVKEMQGKSFKPSTQSAQALRYYTEGLALSRESRHVDAVKRFEAAVQADPNFALAHSRLAQTYDRLDRDDSAQRTSRTAVDLAQELPAREKYLIEAAHARIIGDMRKALEAYSNLSKVSPDDTEVDFALAGLYEATGAFDKAHLHLSKVLERDPKYLDALILMGRIEIRRSNWEAALDRLNPALTLATTFDNDEAKANALHALGVVYRRLTKPEEALRYYQQALDIKRRIGQKGSIATTLNEIGHVHVQLGNADRALENYTEALKLRREVGDRRGIGSSLIDLGVFFAGRSRYDEALKYYKEALQIQRELGNVDYEALCLNNIGNVYLFRGNYDDAVAYFTHSLALREKAKDLPGSALTLHNLGEAYAKMGRFDDSLGNYLRSLDVWRKADERRSAAMEQHYMATVFEYQGRYGAAVNAREEALKTLRDLKDRSAYLAGVLAGYGRALNQIGRFGEAAKQLDEALALARQLKHQALVARTLNYQGEGALYRSDTRSARTLFDQALPAAEATKNSELVLLSKLNLGKLSINERKPQQAAGALRQLARDAEAGGHQYIAADASVSLGEALLAMRQVPQAIDELQRVLARSEKLGMQPLAARSHALLAEALRASNEAAAARHAGDARRILDGIRKEASSGDPLKRADFRAIYSATSQ